MGAVFPQKLVSDFIESESWTLTKLGGLGVRGGRRVYKPDARDQDKDCFREFLWLRIKRLVKKSYRNNVGTDRHIANIKKLKGDLEERYSHILHEGRITLGVVQKLLNLYLKYQWVLKKIPEPPPHCPFDAIVIKTLNEKLNREVSIKWTEMDTEDEYRELVKAAEEASKQKSVAEWELEVWLKAKGLIS